MYLHTERDTLPTTNIQYHEYHYYVCWITKSQLPTLPLIYMFENLRYVFSIIYAEFTESHWAVERDQEGIRRIDNNASSQRRFLA